MVFQAHAECYISGLLRTCWNSALVYVLQDLLSRANDFYWRYDLAELHASSKAREITSTCGNHSKYIWKWLYRHRHESSEQLRGRIIQIGLTGLRGREIAREKKRTGNRENIVIFVSETFYFVRSIPVIMDCEATVCKAHRERSGVEWPFCRHLGCAFAKHPVSR